MEAVGRRLRTLADRTTVAGFLVQPETVLGLAAFVSVGGLALVNGGYFPNSWGWSALGLLCLTFVVLAMGAATRLTRLEAGLLLLLAALTAWTFVSAGWTMSMTRTVLEGERALVYLAAVFLGVLLLRRATVRALLAGVWVAIVIVCAYGLATRLFPKQFGVVDPLSGYRLTHPVGYWNAFGLLAAMGTLLALGFAARGGTVIRCAAAASTIVTVLALYFTFSRGGWIAFFVGLSTAIALDRRRLQLATTALVLALWPLVAIWVASQSQALTRRNSSLRAAEQDGHGLTVIAIALAVGAVLTALNLDRLDSWLRIRPTVKRFWAGTLAFVLAAVLIVVFGRYGLPPTLARKAYHSFLASPPGDQGSLNNRLFSLSSNGRVENWHTAWQDVKAHPWLGSGAGTFDEYWFQHRRNTLDVHDAHNVYLETLAELGPVGLTLLVATLAIPLLALRRARVDPFASLTVGAYVAFLVHAAVDWDWEMPTVTLAALFCGLALLAARRPAEPAEALPRKGRVAATTITLGLAGFALLGLLGNSAVSASSKAAKAENLQKAESEARSAMTWAPWSSAPWRRLGEAQYSEGRLAAARVNFRTAIAKDSHDWTLWFELTLASHGVEQRRALAAAKRLNPRSSELAEFEATLQPRRATTRHARVSALR